MAGKLLYQAFFSYSHSADGALAPAFRLALHRFAKPWYKTRALSVFLDQSSLSANPALWPAIERALSSSEYLVLFASPASAASPWVRKEIEWWLRNRSVDKMLVLLTDGELIWDAARGDFDWQRTTSIAAELTGRFRDEPLYVDLRWTRAEDARGLRSPRFRAAVLDVAAPLHGRGKDELDGDDIRQNRRTMRIARGAAILLALLASAAIWQAIVASQQRNEALKQTGIAKQQTVEAKAQRREAVKQRGIAEQQADEARKQKAIAIEQRDEAVRQRDLAQARSLTAEANRQSANPLQWNLAMLLAIESMRKAPTADNYEALVRLSREGARLVASFPGQYLATFSADGRLVATESDEHLVVHEARGGRERARIAAEGMSSTFTTLCFTPNADRVLGHNREQARLFDIAGHRIIPLPVETRRGGRVEASLDCRFLAVADAGRGSLIDLETATLTGEFAVPPNIGKLAASNDGETVAYTEGMRTTIVNARTGTVRGQWTADREVTALGFSGEPQRLAVSMGSKGLVMLDPAAADRVGDSPASGALTPDGRLSAALSEDGHELVTWDVARGTWTRRLPIARPATNVHWSGDGEFLAYGSGEGDGSTRVLQSESWRQLARFAFPTDASSRTPGFSPSAVRVQLSPTGDLASATDGNRSAIFEIHHDRTAVILPAKAQVGPVALSRDGKRVVFRAVGKLVVFDTMSRRELAEIACANVARGDYHLSSDGRLLIANCGTGTAPVYDVDARRAIANLPAPYGSQVAVSRDGSVAFAGSTVIRAATGARVREVGGASVVALDPHGRRIALVRASDIRLIDLRTIAAGQTIDAGIDHLESVAFSEDGSLLAAGGRDMRVKIFDAKSGKVVRLLEHVEPDQWIFRIHRIVFSPTGKLIATMADDPTNNDRGTPGTLRVFEVSTGHEIARIPFPELAHDLRFAPDDTALEVAVGRRRIRWERYPLMAAEMIRRSCGLVQRNLDALEWARFMGGDPRRDTCPGAGALARFHARSGSDVAAVIKGR
jgi:WD40 repeat protein